jgi:hypothetical protein
MLLSRPGPPQAETGLQLFAQQERDDPTAEQEQELNGLDWHDLSAR